MAMLVVWVGNGGGAHVALAQSGGTGDFGAKLVACLEAEGGKVSDEDKTILVEAASELAGQLGPTLGCDAGASCSTTLASLDCSMIGKSLSGEATMAMFDAGAPEPWAAEVAAALSGRVVACAQAEGGPLSADETAKVESWKGQMAGIFSLMGGAACSTRDKAKGACVTALASLPCAMLGASLNADQEGLMKLIGEPCGPVFFCGFDPASVMSP